MTNLDELALQCFMAFADPPPLDKYAKFEEVCRSAWNGVLTEEQRNRWRRVAKLFIAFVPEPAKIASPIYASQILDFNT